MTTQSTSPVICCAGKDKRLPGLTLATVLVAILVFSRLSHAEWHGDAEAHMGTEVSVYLWHDDAEIGKEAVAAVFREMSRIDQLMSTYIPTSEVSILNDTAADGPVDTSAELFSLIERSLDISKLTRGAFDITYESVGQHYDFRQGKRPDESTLAQELPLIDYQLVDMNRIDRTVRYRQPGVRINLGGIAKGYAVERGIDVVRQYGVANARVTAGGDTRLLGDRLGQPWMVGIQNPRDESEVAVTIPLQNEAISTSGDYERYFLDGDDRIHHIIVPDTGEPAGDVRSASIIGPDPIMTDALSTSVFVLGLDQGLRLIATLPDYEGIVIDANGHMYYSDGLRPPD